DGRHFLGGEQRIVAADDGPMDEGERAARAVLRRRGVARVHGLAVDTHMRVDVVSEEATRGPTLLRALEVTQRSIVVEVLATEGPELAGLRVDRSVKQCGAAHSLLAEQQESAVSARR